MSSSAPTPAWTALGDMIVHMARFDDPRGEAMSGYMAALTDVRHAYDELVPDAWIHLTECLDKAVQINEKSSRVSAEHKAGYSAAITGLRSLIVASIPAERTRKHTLYLADFHAAERSLNAETREHELGAQSALNTVAGAAYADSQPDDITFIRSDHAEVILQRRRDSLLNSPPPSSPSKEFLDGFDRMVEALLYG